ncbi:DUF2267 domain-containing protein [Rhizobium sp. P40RR-XXII]|uniref:DUF2267 domain-containing protein n=1 Tax=Rhizobium sp. P40RR-XXII TaxID=2726739 RepID=UPI0014570E14|nr:DUF2267 domain-containing protein [Rhizobium sp. P40RR-XXII]NLS20366.1 DUF2267 domain-containing protein [Rhizobium sp. P40RR-XXII]
MSYFPLRTFPDAAQQANLWVHELADRLNCEQREAYEVLRTVLQVLRDSMTVHDLSEFANYLPVLLRGIFFENWHPAAATSARNSTEHFPAAVAARLDCSEPEGRDAIAEVFKLLELRANPFIAEKLRALPRTALSSPMSAGSTPPG